MPRTARASVGGICYHVLNRGNGRAEVFHDPADYRAFLTLLKEAGQRVPMRVLGFCLMPNHFHLVLWPRAEGDLSRYLQWLLTSHVRRYHKRYRSSGHVWQGRFKAFPIEEDAHLLTVLRYVERNPLRARLVKRAENWRWSSLSRPKPPFLHESPVPLPRNWVARVNAPETAMGGEMGTFYFSPLVRGLEAAHGCGHRTACAAVRCGMTSSFNPPSMKSLSDSYVPVRPAGSRPAITLLAGC